MGDDTSEQTEQHMKVRIKNGFLTAFVWPLEGNVGLYAQGVANFGLFVAVAGAMTFAAIGLHRWAWAASGMALISLVVAVVASVAEVRLYRSRKPYPKPVEQADTASSSTPSKSFEMATEQYEFLVRALVSPKTVVARVRERVEVRSRATSIDTRLFFDTPTDAGVLYVPVFILQKGHLIDQLDVRTGDGVDLPILPYNSYIHLMAQVIERIARCLPGESQSVWNERDLGTRAVDAIKQRRDADSALPTNGERSALLDALKELGESGAALTLIAMVELLSLNYCQIVAVPSDGDGRSGVLLLHAHYSQVQTLRTTPLQRRLTSLAVFAVNQVRVLFGVRSSTFQFPLDKAVRAASYHLEYLGPEGTYLAKQAFSGPTLTAAEPLPVDHAAYARNRRRDGQRYAHVYIRDARDPMRDVQAQFTFFERSPGSVASAAVAASVCAVLAFTIGYLQSELKAAADPELLALLLAFPATASGIIGLDRPNGPLGGALAARLGSLVTFVLSVIMTVAVLGVPLGAPGWASDLHLAGLDGGWCFVVMLTVTNAVCLGAAWLRRSFLYAKVLHREAR